MVIHKIGLLAALLFLSLPVCYAESVQDQFIKISNTKTLTELMKYQNTGTVYETLHVINVIADLNDSKKRFYLKRLWLEPPTDRYSDPRVKLTLAKALLVIDTADNQHYSAYVKQQAKSKDWKILIRVSEALAVVDDDEAVRLLSEFSRSTHLFVAKSAAKALVEISKTGREKISARQAIEDLLQSNQIKLKKVTAILAGEQDSTDNNSTASIAQRSRSEVERIINTYLEKNKFKEGISRLLPSADGGNVDAQALLGKLYLSGPDDVKDYARAIFWLESRLRGQVLSFAFEVTGSGLVFCLLSMIV